MDPDTEEVLEGGPFPPERLSCFEDYPFEEPMNKDEPLWIHIRFNSKGTPDRWVLRRIAAQSTSGMHRLVSRDRKHDEIVDLSQHSWYFVYEPHGDPAHDDEDKDSRHVPQSKTDDSLASEGEQDAFEPSSQEE